MSEEKDLGKVLVNRPKDTRFHQQRLRSWRPTLTAKGAYPIFLTVGLLFIPVGVVLLITSNSVIEKVHEYTHCDGSQSSGIPTRCSEEVRKPSSPSSKPCICKIDLTLDAPINGPVYFFYGLSNFYQNHRRYIMSKDDAQLHGDIGSLSADCEPYRYNWNKTRYAPCGAIAMSLFNDTFTLKYENAASSTIVNLSQKNIAWRSDVEKKYGKPSDDSWNETVKPDSWPLSAKERSADAYSGDEPLLVWMRPAALPTFRKLYGIVEQTGLFVNGLPAGRYSVDIVYAYPVTQFGGTKRFILTTSNWLGGRNPTLGIAYIVTGIVSLLLGLLFLFLHYFLPRRFNLSRT